MYMINSFVQLRVHPWSPGETKRIFLNNLAGCLNNQLKILIYSKINSHHFPG
jgi:hypothetical protein